MKKNEVLTTSTAELSDGVDESLVEVGGPTEAGLGIGGQDEAWVSPKILAMASKSTPLVDLNILLTH